MKITVGCQILFIQIIYSHISPSLPPYFLQHGYVILYFSPNFIQFTNFFICLFTTTAGLKFAVRSFLLHKITLTIFNYRHKSSVDGWRDDLLGEFTKQRYLFTIPMVFYLSFGTT